MPYENCGVDRSARRIEAFSILDAPALIPVRIDAWNGAVDAFPEARGAFFLDKPAGQNNFRFSRGPG